MGRWTMQQVEQHAPDPRSLAAASRLARPGPWSETGSTTTLVWGKCQGSGATPYQVTVDLTGPQFTCTCPSRKEPCKHSLALLMRWVAGDGSMTEVAVPASPVAGRRRPPGTCTAASTTAARPSVDPDGQRARLARRLELMDGGMAELESWLEDLVSHGLANARHRDQGWWEGMAARLVDAQLPGLGERVRAMGSAVHRRDDWADHLLAEAGRWYLAVQAWARRDELSAGELGDLRAFVGWPVRREEMTGRQPVQDRWIVAGVHRTLDGRLQSQRTWLVGRDTGQVVVVLDFAAAGGQLGVAQVVGTVLDAGLVLHPGGAPQRAVIPADAAVSNSGKGHLGPADDVGGVLARVATWVAGNPWSDRLPALLGPVRLDPAPEPGPSWGWAIDDSGAALPLAPGVDGWRILARSGGRPVELFGEVEDGALRPLTLASSHGLVPL